MTGSSRYRSLALFAALFAVAAMILPMRAVARPGSQAALIRLVGTVQLSARVQSPSSGRGAPDAPLSELGIIRERMEEESPSSSGGRSPALSSQLPSASDFAPGAHSSGATWVGLNHFDIRYADGGNSFSSEPADMAMCAGKGYVMEMVNGAIQIYTETGRPKLKGTYGNAGGATSLSYAGPKAFSLNEFFGQPIAFDRGKYFDPVAYAADPSNTFGPNLFDVVCTYDDGSDTWFAVSAVLGVDDETGDFNGYSGLLLAVNKASPVDNWTVYEINTTNDGNGSPDHDCDGGPCFGDYPQLGVDRNGVYITTNEFALFGGGYYGAQLYAIRKADLVQRATTPAYAYLQNIPSSEVGDLAYTLQPVNSQDAQRLPNRMFFGMSHAPYADVATTELSVFELATGGLNSNPPSVVLGDLTEHAVDVKNSGGTSVPYGTPNHALQKASTDNAATPFLSLLNSGFFGARYAQQAGPIPLDAGSGKFYGAWLSGGYVYLTTATAAQGPGGATYSSSNGGWAAINQRSAAAIFTVDVSSGVDTETSDARVIGVPGQNLIYPSVAVNAGGSGAIGTTLVGPGYWPQAAYVSFTSSAGVLGGLTVNVKAPISGGPNDGFTGTGDGGYRTRWGDYGAAAVDSQGDVWLAMQSIEQRCSVPGYKTSVPLGTCDNKRSVYANWGSRIIEVDL